MDMKWLEKLDSRTMVMIFLVVIAGALTFGGDQYAFVKGANNFFQNFLVLPHVLFFKIAEDRVTTNAFVFGFWLMLIGGGGTFAFTYITDKFIEPMNYKRILEQKKRDEKILNDLD
jgi:hypothetical protein